MMDDYIPLHLTCSDSTVYRMSLLCRASSSIGISVRSRSKVVRSPTCRVLRSMFVRSRQNGSISMEDRHMSRSRVIRWPRRQNRKSPSLSIRLNRNRNPNLSLNPTRHCPQFSVLLCHLKQKRRCRPLLSGRSRFSILFRLIRMSWPETLSRRLRQCRL